MASLSDDTKRIWTINQISMATNNGPRTTSLRAQLRNYDDGMCAICLNPHFNKSHPDCGHVFCFRCLVDWCQIKLECPTCKQPFKNFHHDIQIRPSFDQIYTPDPPPAAVESQTLQQINLSIISERGGQLQTWIISTANRLVLLPMPLSSHERLNDPDFRLWFVNFLNREFNVSVIDIVRNDPA